MLLGAADLVEKRWWRSAFFFAAAVWVKLTPMVVALLFAALWPRRLGPKLLAALLVLGLVPFLSRPPAMVWGHYCDWVGHLSQTGSERWPGFRDAWTVWIVVCHLFEGKTGAVYLLDPLNSTVYRAVQLMAAAGVLGWCLLQKRAGIPSRQLVLSAFAAGCAWLMLFGPSIEHATFVFLAPVLAWAMLDRTGDPANRPLAWAAGLLILFLGFGGVARVLGEGLPLTLTALPVGTALFAVWLVVNQGLGTQALCGPTEPLCGSATSRQAA
jgi:hypothetical protein